MFDMIKGSDSRAYVLVSINRSGEATFTLQLDLLAKQCDRASMFIYRPQCKKVFEGDSVKLGSQISTVPPPNVF